MKKLKVLVEDNQVVVRQQLLQELRKDEYIEIVGAVDNGKDAYEIFEREEPNIVIFDLLLPIYDGYVLLDKMNEHGIHNNQKLVMTTPLTNNMLVSEAFNQGVDYVLTKPYDARAISVQLRMIHDKMKRLNITVERLDYKELIKKYNGKTYQEQDKKENTEEQFARYNKLWYFDPPYHPATLSGGKAAPYENTFEIKQTMEMTELLHGDKADEYSEIGYFIKSDYDPKDIYEHAEDKTVIQQYFHDFDVLEDNIEWPGHKANTENPIFYKMFLGEFYKGDDDGMGGRLKGREYIWCRGNYIPGT